MSEEEKTDPEKTEELFAFLQGTIPDGYKIPEEHVSHLTPYQAWTVIWYLQNLYWQPSDRIERCGVCGGLYDTHSEGDCLDYGGAPYHFCEDCMASNEYATKAKEQNNDKV